MDTMRLDELSQQLLQVSSEGNRTILCVKISKQDRSRCDRFAGASCAALTSVVKVEVEETAGANCDSLGDDEGLLVGQQSCLLPNCTLHSTDVLRTCLLCLRSTLKFHQLTGATWLESENELLQEIFQTTSSRKLTTIKEGIFCKCCFISVENLRACYLKFKEAHKAYQETLLRIRCFRNCAQKTTLSTNSLELSPKEIDDDHDHFTDADEKNVDAEQPAEPRLTPIIIRLSGNKLSTGSGSKQKKKKGAAKRKPIRRRGGRTEEEYREHRRLQSIKYYQKRKIRMGKMESRRKSSRAVGAVTSSAEIKAESESECILGSAPVSPISSPTFDSEFEDIDEYFEDIFKEVESVTSRRAKPLVKPAKMEKSTSVNTTKKKKKHDYKGKTMYETILKRSRATRRKRGGLTEEECQEHRRLQSIKYYQKRRKRMGDVDSRRKSSKVTSSAEVKVESECSLDSAPVSPISSQAFDSKSFNHKDIDEHFEDTWKEVELVTSSGAKASAEPVEIKKSTLRLNNGRFDYNTRRKVKLVSCSGTKPSKEPEETEEVAAVNKTKKKKKKYDYKGKPIRRRGGLTEEEYQAHRRALSHQYYVKRRLKSGKLTYGPKPLGVVARMKLEKEAKLILDSNNLPARSSCGKALPVIQIEPGKRFSYRKVEFTKEDDGTLRCGNCNHTAKALNALKKHITKNHFDREHGFKCSYCDRSFYYRYQLVYHENRHTEKGAGVQCEECGQTFKHPTTYFAHRRIVHFGVKPHECQLCQKKFGTRKDLRKHNESKSHLAKVAENSELPATLATVWNSF